MNTTKLVELAATKANTTQQAAASLLNALIDSITQAVADGEKVTLVGFGSFEARERKARDGRNPKTDEQMKIPATVVPAFSANKESSVTLKRSNYEAPRPKEVRCGNKRDAETAPCLDRNSSIGSPSLDYPRSASLPTSSRAR
jgi:DNA-binding protein HU-beta